jgi:membrane protease YdiL (CAAX protease family)
MPVTTRVLLPFFALAFAITWALAGALMLLGPALEPMLGPPSGTHPLFILAAWGPAMAAIALVWKHEGTAGLRDFLRRLTLWRMPIVWWLLLLFLHAGLSYAGAALNGTLAQPFPFSPWYAVVPATVLALFIGPMEEIGWRGLALPLLQRRFTPFGASVVLGLVWAAWHLPVFFMSGSPQYGWSMGGFFLGVIAMSIVMTAMFNASGGSMLTAVLFHWQANQPAWPDGQPWSSLLFIGVAALVLVLDRRAMFRRDGAATDMLLPASPDRVIPASNTGKEPVRTA